MAAPDIDLNPLVVFVTVTGAMLGPQVAYYVGAYAIIFLGWFAGLLYGLYRREDSKMPVWAYTVSTLLAAVAATVPLSEWASHYIPFAYTVLLFPVAFVIPAVPDKLVAFGATVLRKWRAEK
jgi:hypothetical protein